MTYIGSKISYVTCGEEVTKLSNNRFSSQPDMRSNQEEADTRMLLHADFASSSIDKILISSSDTDVFVMSLAKSEEIDASLFMLTGAKSKHRIIDINAVINELCEVLPLSCSKQLFLESLVGFHSFTGCDTVSAFAGKGKVKPFKLMITSKKNVDIFGRLGRNEVV